MVIDIYAAMADGVWLYEPQAHRLLPYLSGDIRAETGLQDFVGVAPLDLIYVAHGERMADIGPEERRLYASVDAGFIGQNVYLFCASAGLATVFRGAVPYADLTKKLALPAGAVRHLRPDRRISRRVSAASLAGGLMPGTKFALLTRSPRCPNDRGIPWTSAEPRC